MTVAGYVSLYADCLIANTLKEALCTNNKQINADGLFQSMSTLSPLFKAYWTKLKYLIG